MVILRSKQSKTKMKIICNCHAKSLGAVGVEYLTTSNPNEIEIRQSDYNTYEIELGLDLWELT
jgi:hypothetical protein